MMQTSYDIVASEFNAVNALIYRQLHSDVALVEDISQYLVASGGKRVRPLVTLLMAGALQSAHDERQIQLAAAIEFLHTATLLHDDVVDMSVMRRGKPTANANWGNASSVLVGDFVYSRAFQLLVGIQSLPVLEVLSQTTSKIAEGEVQQLSLIGDIHLTEAQYFEVIRNKTAQLFEGACKSAAIIAGADAQLQQRVNDYGQHLGMAFQLVDDYLDYAGDASDLGKNVGDDLTEGKLTLPLIEALRKTQSNNAADYQSLTRIISNKDLKSIPEVIRITETTGALNYTLDCAKQHIALAQQQLDGLADSDYRRELRRVSEFVLARTH